MIGKSVAGWAMVSFVWKGLGRTNGDQDAQDTERLTVASDPKGFFWKCSTSNVSVQVLRGTTKLEVPEVAFTVGLEKRVGVLPEPRIRNS